MVEDLDGGPWNWDSAHHRFWPLSAFVSVRDFRGGGPEWPGWSDHWFAFADHLVNSFAFVVRLTAEPSDGGQVAIWDFAEVRSAVTPTFEEFLSLYVAIPGE